VNIGEFQHFYGVKNLRNLKQFLKATGRECERIRTGMYRSKFKIRPKILARKKRQVGQENSGENRVIGDRNLEFESFVKQSNYVHKMSEFLAILFSGLKVF